jgi:hypothetical protein
MRTIPLSVVLQAIILVLLMNTKLNAQWIQSGPYNNFILAFESIGTKLFAGSYGGGVYLSSDNGTNWIAVTPGLTNWFVSSLTVSGSILFAGTDDGVFLTTNSGTLWTHKGLSGKYVQTLALDGTHLYAGTFGDGAFVSTNNGTSWTAINSGLNSDYVISIVLKDTIIFAGTWGGGVFKSTNHGANWISANNGLTNLDVRSLAAIDTNIFAGTYGHGVFLSKNDGNSWTAVNNGLINKIILPMTTSGTNLFAGTSGGGVFLSTDYGSNWNEVNYGLTNLSITALKVMGPKIFAGTVNTGIWRRPLSEVITTIKPDDTKTPDNFYLAQNYPNPFNPITRISFRIPEKSYVRLRIFDVLGNELIALISDELDAGTYTKEWNATSCTDGVYFLILEAGLHKATKKMILLK